MSELIALALLSAVYPTLVAVAVVALAGPRPARIMAVFLFGGMITSVAVGVAIVFAMQATSVVDVDGSNSPLNSIVYFGFGAFVLLLAADIVRRPARQRVGGAWVERLLSHSQKAGVALVAGVVLNVAPGAWYVVALKDIAESSYDTVEVLALIAAFCVVQFALIEVPLLTFVVAPDRATELSRRFSRWFGENSRATAVGVLAAGGCYLIVRGILAVL